MAEDRISFGNYYQEQKAAFHSAAINYIKM